MATNDVELKPQRYKDERPKEYFDQYHARVRDHEPEARSYEPVRIVTVLHALITFRARGIGSERVPGGPLILAPNHASFMDHFFAGAFIRRRIQFMAKSQLFKAGGIATYIFTHGGVFPVRRGHQDDEAFISAFKILERGGAIGMYCEGGRSRTGELADEARPGIGRLALESGAPVVPVAILGSHQVRNWKRLQFPRVTVSYGEPLRFDVIEHPTREQQQQAADCILERIRVLHDELVRLGHTGARKAARARLAGRT
ncbi:MAG TPA: lysophospholipid acyltransferase family protein [Solirubrobacteraceae bacterium]